jgi:hypothetical protein
MTATLDPRDVPAVGAAILATALRRLIAAGHGPALVSRLDGEARLLAAEVLWSTPEQGSGERAAAMLRLECLADALAHPRLGRWLETRGFLALDAVARVAAEARLHAARGFNPTTLAWRLARQLANDVGEAQTTAVASTAPVRREAA